jgi:hypothetical protein
LGVEVGFEGLAALSDDAEAVILEVSKAVSAALDEFHFAVEAFGDAVVFGEAPHASDLLPPGGEGMGQSDQRREA